MMWPIILGGGMLLLAFAVVYILLRDFLIEFVYGPEYIAFTVAVILVAFRPFLTLQKSMLTKGLQAIKNTRSVFAGTLLGSGAGIAIGGALLLMFGLPAAGSIVIVSRLITIFWFARTWREHLADEAKWQTDFEHAPQTTESD